MRFLPSSFIRPLCRLGPIMSSLLAEKVTPDNLHCLMHRQTTIYRSFVFSIQLESQEARSARAGRSIQFHQCLDNIAESSLWVPPMSFSTASRKIQTRFDAARNGFGLLESAASKTLSWNSWPLSLYRAETHHQGEQHSIRQSQGTWSTQSQWLSSELWSSILPTGSGSSV